MTYLLVGHFELSEGLVGVDCFQKPYNHVSRQTIRLNIEAFKGGIFLQPSDEALEKIITMLHKLQNTEMYWNITYMTTILELHL